MTGSPGYGGIDPPGRIPGETATRNTQWVNRSSFAHIFHGSPNAVSPIFFAARAFATPFRDLRPPNRMDPQQIELTGKAILFDHLAFAFAASWHLGVYSCRFPGQIKTSLER